MCFSFHRSHGYRTHIFPTQIPETKRMPRLFLTGENILKEMGSCWCRFQFRLTIPLWMAFISGSLRILFKMHSTKSCNTAVYYYMIRKTSSCSSEGGWSMNTTERKIQEGPRRWILYLQYAKSHKVDFKTDFLFLNVSYSFLCAAT